MSKTLKVVYVGTDLSYWKGIQDRFASNYPDFKFKFHHLGEEDFKHQEVFLELYDLKPDIIYIDFGANDKGCLELLKILRKENEMKKVSTSGLHDYLTSKEVVQRSIMTGVRINQIKGGELHDVIYDSICFSHPEDAAEPVFAMARFKFETYLLQDLRAAYLNNQCFHVETNTTMTEGSLIEVSENALEKIMPSQKFKIANIKDTNLYYNTRFGLDLEYTYIDPTPPSDLEDETIDAEEKQKIKENWERECKESLDETKHKVDKWVSERATETEPKKIKVLIVDKSMDVIKNASKPLSDYPYSITLQGHLTEEQLQVKRKLPQIIVFNWEKEEEKEEAKEDEKKGDEKAEQGAKKADEEESKPATYYNRLESLKSICRTIATVDHYDPIIVVFNSPHTTENLRTGVKYDRVISYSSSIEFDIVLGLIQKLKDNLAKQDIQNTEPRVYFKSTDANSFLAYKRPITIQAMTESEIYFVCEGDLPVYTVFKMETPLAMFVTVIPHRANSEWEKIPGSYRGLINGVGEEEKKAIRHYINQIFFIEKNEKKKAEQEEFEKKKAEFQQKQKEEEEAAKEEESDE